MEEANQVCTQRLGSRPNTNPTDSLPQMIRSVAFADPGRWIWRRQGSRKTDSVTREDADGMDGVFIASTIVCKVSIIMEVIL